MIAERFKYMPIVAVIIAIVMTVLDGTIMNVALPSLTKEFKIEPNTAIWLINIYQMAIMMFLLVFATVGDIFGYRKVFLCGLGLFTLASAFCAFSWNFESLIVSRTLQGIGASAVMSVNTALVRLIYPPKILGRGMSYNAVAVAVSSAAGPTIAGVILSSLSWHWLFAINIPLGIIAFYLGYKLLPASQNAIERKFDYRSAIGDTIASRRLAKNSHIHAVRCHLRLLFHGANASISIHSIFPARHIAFFARRNRTAHHTVADSHNDCRAACRKACGTFPPRNAWRYRHVSVFNRIDFVILFAGKRR